MFNERGSVFVTLSNPGSMKRLLDMRCSLGRDCWHYSSCCLQQFICGVQDVDVFDTAGSDVKESGAAFILKVSAEIGSGLCTSSVPRKVEIF